MFVSQAEKKYDSLYFSAISTWGIGKLEEKGRLNLAVPARKWIDYALVALPLKK